MTHFYQPHVREPVFLALTRVSLWALEQQDAAVSLASAIGSMLAIFATYLVGAALISPLGGLAAALILAIDYQVITWSVDGWRDDTFTATRSAQRVGAPPAAEPAVVRERAARGLRGRRGLPDSHHRALVHSPGPGVAGRRRRPSALARAREARGDGVADTRRRRCAVSDQLRDRDRRSAHRHQLSHPLLPSHGRASRSRSR